MVKKRNVSGQPDRCILILGGGFAGIYTALGLESELKPSDRTEVILVNAENFFLFTPFLCEVASSSIDTSHAINPIRRMFKHTRFIEGEAVELDLEKRSVLVRQPGGREHGYSYDQLVIALGARTGYFGMRDVQKHALTVKTLGDAINLRNWAIQLLETADVEHNPAIRAELLTFVVAGGGLTGVEVAGEINDLVRQALPAYPSITQRELRVVLVEAQSRLVPELDENLGRFTLNRLRTLGVEVQLNARVSGATVTEVRLKDKEAIPSRTLVWTTGVAPNPFIAASALPKDDKGWITVDAHFRVPGHQYVWSLGDCARVPDILRPGHYHPSTAQHAIREARQLARNIVASIHETPTQPFRYKTMGQMATLGHFTGVGTVGPFPVWGFAAWAIWRTYYLYRLPRLEKRLRVATDWTVDLLFGRDISQIQTKLSASEDEPEPEKKSRERPPSSKIPVAAGTGRSQAKSNKANGAST